MTVIPHKWEHKSSSVFSEQDLGFFSPFSFPSWRIGRERWEQGSGVSAELKGKGIRAWNRRPLIHLSWVGGGEGWGDCLLVTKC